MICMQAFPEFLLQGKHFAYSLHAPFFADEESSALVTLYGGTAHPQPLDDWMQKVCPT